MFKLSTVETLLSAVEERVITLSAKARNDKPVRENTLAHSGTHTRQTTLCKSTHMGWKTGKGPMTISETKGKSAGSGHTATKLLTTQSIKELQLIMLFTVNRDQLNTYLPLHKDPLASFILKFTLVICYRIYKIVLFWHSRRAIVNVISHTCTLVHQEPKA